MQLFTEKEYQQQSEHYVFRLRNLYLENSMVFYQFQDFLPSPVYINHRENSNYEYFNKVFFSYGKEIESLYDLGKSYLNEISELHLLNAALSKASSFNKLGDFDSVCNYLQCISLNKVMTPFFTNKILIDNNLTLNTTLFLNEYPLMDKMFKEIVPSGKNAMIQWQRFQSLTKREKELLKLFAKGKSNKEVSQILIISIHSVHTHKRNIYQKLDISKTSELVKIAMFLELI